MRVRPESSFHLTADHSEVCSIVAKLAGESYTDLTRCILNFALGKEFVPGFTRELGFQQGKTLGNTYLARLRLTVPRHIASSISSSLMMRVHRRRRKSRRPVESHLFDKQRKRFRFTPSQRPIRLVIERSFSASHSQSGFDIRPIGDCLTFLDLLFTAIAAVLFEKKPVCLTKAGGYPRDYGHLFTKTSIHQDRQPQCLFPADDHDADGVLAVSPPIAAVVASIPSG